MKLSGTFTLGKTKQRKMPRMRKSEKSSSQTDGKGSRTILKEETKIWAMGGNLSSLPVTLEVISQYTVGDRRISRPPTAHYLFKGIFFNFILFI